MLSDGEVALLAEADAVALRGRAHAAVAPHVDGSRTAEEIVGRADDAAPPAVLHYALLRLLKAGLLVEGPAVPLRALAVQAREDFVITDDYLRPELDAWVRAALGEGRTVTPCRPVGDAVWVGPSLRPGDRGVWDLLLRRLRLNRPAHAAVVDSSAGFPLFAVDVSEQAIRSGLALAAGQAVAGELRTVDRASGEIVRHPLAEVSPRPRAERIVLRAAPKRFVADGGHRVVPPADSVARMERFASALTGIVSPPQLRSGTALPVYTATHAGPPSLAVHGRQLRQPNGCAGKGLTDVQARASCLGEGIERHCCGFFGDEPLRRAGIAELGDSAVDPRDVLLFSDAQYAERDAGRSPRDGFNAVPARFDPESRIEWVPLTSLTTGATRWFPAAMCFFAYADPEARTPPFARADSNGAAAGNTLEEAVLQGLLELIERDAVALWWYPRTARRGIDLATFHEPKMDAVAEAHAARGRELRLLDLTSDIRIPVVGAVSWRRETGGQIGIGLGAHLDPGIAASRAISELEQSAGAAPSALPENLDHALWIRDATVETEPYVLPALDQPPLSAAALPRIEHDDVGDDIAWCVRTLERSGHEVLVYDHTRPDVGFPVVRVVAPGLRHFWKRLAPGRLYDVPVALGHVDSAPAESELNPRGCFL